MGKNDNKTGKGSAAEVEAVAGTTGQDAETSAPNRPENVEQAVEVAERKLTDIYDLGRITFKIPTNDAPYPPRRDGQITKPAATFILPYRGANLGTPGTVYARLKRGAKVPTLDPVFVGSRTGATAISPFNDAAVTELDELRAEIAKHYIEWRSAQPKARKRPGTVEAPADMDFGGFEVTD